MHTANCFMCEGIKKSNVSLRNDLSALGTLHRESIISNAPRHHNGPENFLSGTDGLLLNGADTAYFSYKK